ncbi:hypothetical protein [Streptacidiphilus sp. EB129]|uniref:hypothetical protein n=1 Tax=Streptacidiphilus sp. EB129 TaxID=3156262 RepID=UPI0035165C76
MPSLRNPVGPLPSSIYWRRRLVVLVVLAAAFALLMWLLFGGGNGTAKVGSASPSGSHPATSITPGPTGSGNGGSSDGSTAGNGGKGPTPSGSASAPAGTTGGVVSVDGGTGSGPGSGSGSGSGSGGSTAAPGTGGGATPPPANAAGTMNLPACAAADVELSLTSTEQSYNSSQWPAFQLAVSNTSGAACRVDLGAESAVVVVSSSSSPHVWSSGDCPRVTAAQWYAVPASGAPITAVFQWARTTSAPGCTPGHGGAAAAPGTYVARVGITGVTVQPSHQFKLAPFGS